MKLCLVSAMTCLLVDPAVGFTVGEMHGSCGGTTGTMVGAMIGVGSGWSLVRLERNVGRNQGRNAVGPFAFLTLVAMFAPIGSVALAVVAVKGVALSIEHAPAAWDLLFT